MNTTKAGMSTHTEAEKVGHTPGPWIVRTFPPTNWNGLRDVWVTDSTPDRFGKFVGQIIATPTTAPESAANMRLIAAAPELIRLLKNSLELLNRIPLVAVEANIGADICQARREIGATIAKAEGNA